MGPVEPEQSIFRGFQRVFFDRGVWIFSVVWGRSRDALSGLGARSRAEPREPAQRTSTSSTTVLGNWGTYCTICSTVPVLCCTATVLVGAKTAFHLSRFSLVSQPGKIVHPLQRTHRTLPVPLPYKVLATGENDFSAKITPRSGSLLKLLRDPPSQAAAKRA